MAFEWFIPRGGMRGELRDSERKYLGFLGTLFLFVALASLCTVLPGYEPPTGSLST